MSVCVPSLSVCVVGQLVRFTYGGGSTPGRERTILVEDKQGDRLLGIDQETGKPRWFLFDRANNVVVIAQRDSVEKMVKAGNKRVIRQVMPFTDARQLLHDQIDELNAEDLVEALVLLDGQDRGRFDSANGQVILETDVQEPRFDLCQGGIVVINQDGERAEATFETFNGDVTAKLNGETVTPDEMIGQLLEHLAY